MKSNYLYKDFFGYCLRVFFPLILWYLLVLWVIGGGMIVELMSGEYNFIVIGLSILIFPIGLLLISYFLNKKTNNKILRFLNIYLFWSILFFASSFLSIMALGSMSIAENVSSIKELLYFALDVILKPTLLLPSQLIVLFLTAVGYFQVSRWYLLKGEDMKRIVNEPSVNSNSIIKTSVKFDQNNVGKTILFIDDDQLILDMYGKKAEEAGFKVVKLKNIENNKMLIDFVSELNPDLISIDVIMPVMSGIEAVKILKSDSRTKDIPIFGLDNITHDTKDQLIKAGAVDYYIKAMVLPSDIINTYTEYLKNPKNYKVN